MGEFTIRNARLVLADEVIEGDLHVRDGMIHAVDHQGAVPAGAEDFAGDYLLPGLVELHTDHLENHFAPRPGVQWNPLAAVQAHDAQVAGSGITTVFDALRAGTDEDAGRLGRDMQSLAGAIARGRSEDRLRADHYIHLRCEISSRDVVDEIEPYLGDPIVRLISLMDHTPGQRQFASLDTYRRYYQGRFGMSDEAMARFIEERLENHRLYAATSRAAVVERCRGTGLTLASHDDATREHVAEAVEAGVVISEFPTTLEAAEAARAAGFRVLMGAPNVVRGGSHSGNVAATSLAESGLLDVLSSDYVPFSLLTAAFLLPERVPGMSLPRAVALVTREPADAVGMSDRGEIAHGRRADFVRVRHDGDLPAVRGVWREGRRVA
ncbi:alpha-D-ribose 1-methylphosphonate 5-triphosphate diphosphatase [Lutibaculum baratangense]|nr:alpha-D-ribose 1-methylphosphonate 5-triphosphate diphosphatase [Lutibaculum baratangense]